MLRSGRRGSSSCAVTTHEYKYNMECKIVSLKEGENGRSSHFAALFSTRSGLFVCSFRHRARLPRRHPGRACTAACSRARAAGIVAEVCETGYTSARMCPLLKTKR